VPIAISAKDEAVHLVPALRSRSVPEGIGLARNSDPLTSIRSLASERDVVGLEPVFG